jgi:hypothetical protein
MLPDPGFVVRDSRVEGTLNEVVGVSPLQS